MNDANKWALIGSRRWRIDSHSSAPAAFQPGNYIDFQVISNAIDKIECKVLATGAQVMVVASATAGENIMVQLSKGGDPNTILIQAPVNVNGTNYTLNVDIFVLDASGQTSFSFELNERGRGDGGTGDGKPD